MQAHPDYFIQTTHPGSVQLDGDLATGCAYIGELYPFHHDEL